MLAQFLHIWIVACIMYVMTSGFRIFLRLRRTADFSYLALLIFGAYSLAIFMEHGYSFIGAFAVSLLLLMSFCLLLLRIITRLSSIYFNIGTFALYILMSYIATNIEITHGSFGMSVMHPLIGQSNSIAILYTILIILVMVGMTYFRRSLLYTMLAGWGEFRTALRSMGVREYFPLFFLIIITTFMALIGGSMYLGYYAYIGPNTFWIGFLITLMATTYGSYIFSEKITFLITLGIWYIYEMFRFVKIVDASQIGYFREMLFSLMVMVIVFFVFRRLSFSREQ